MKTCVFVLMAAWIVIFCSGGSLFAIDNEVEGYFNDKGQLEKTINGAIQEGALAGFHGAINKADYLINQSKIKPQYAKLFMFMAWWNLLNAHLILDEASALPTNKKLPGQDTNTLVSVMLKADDMRYKIEKEIFKWNKEKSFDRFQQAFLMIKDKLGENPIKK